MSKIKNYYHDEIEAGMMDKFSDPIAIIPEDNTVKVTNLQKERVLQYLQVHGSMTILDAWHELGVFSLSSRISRLILDDGIKITKTWDNKTNRYGEKYKIRRYHYVE